ncbi:Hypothetical protein FKW44_010519 [Caligus rogercresseyi]|uniref:Uncharacterized protein n=1 Tax=Caligus rogercresseyi TaxID=217165 RepID=A0A7T8K9L5_CALRO|nr:Hypothetical protein FKW44_010519 [Caligus rogercresseyi]
MFLLQRRGRRCQEPDGDFVFPIPRRPMRSTTQWRTHLGGRQLLLHVTQYLCGTCLRP